MHAPTYPGADVHETQMLILGLCVAIPALSVIARLVGVPYPIVLVLGAIPLGYLPGVPNVELDPELMLVIFLPPLLYVAAFFADLRALKTYARALSLTAIGLVLLTTIVVGVVDTSSWTSRGQWRSPSARSSPRPTRLPRPRLPVSFVCRGGS